jgi:hypothetical protein
MHVKGGGILFLLAVIFSSGWSSSTPPPHGFCVIGAGPGGLQIGHYLATAGRKTTTFERSDTAGSFFQQFPIHRQLISVNKRNTGRDSPEFNLRHDWNSLLDNEGCAPVPNRTKARFPDAKHLVDYLQDFAKQQPDIQYNADVKRVEKGKDGAFSVTVETMGETVQHTCSLLVVATGVGEPRMLPYIGGDLVTGYHSLPPTGDIFEGKAVAVFGMGNAAFEVAGAAEDFANYVHVFNTRGEPSLSFSWETRYVGSPRASRINLLDGYLLKSLDALPLGKKLHASPTRLMIQSCFGTKKCLFRIHRDENGDILPEIATFNHLNDERREFIAELSRNFSIPQNAWKERWVEQSHSQHTTISAEIGDLSAGDLKRPAYMLGLPLQYFELGPEFVGKLQTFRSWCGDNFARYVLCFAAEDVVFDGLPFILNPAFHAKIGRTTL